MIISLTVLHVCFYSCVQEKQVVVPGSYCVLFFMLTQHNSIQSTLMQGLFMKTFSD